MPATEWQQNPHQFCERSRTLTNEKARESGLFHADPCSPKAEVTDSNSVGCANPFNTLTRELSVVPQTVPTQSRAFRLFDSPPYLTHARGLAPAALFSLASRRCCLPELCLADFCQGMFAEDDRPSQNFRASVSAHM